MPHRIDVAGAVGKTIRSTQWMWTLAAVIFLSLVFSACESAESHIEKAKAMVGQSAAVPSSRSESKEVLDLRSADLEAERYLPALERLERRQQTIRRVLSKQPARPQ